MAASERARAVWGSRLGSAFRTALACAIVGCATLYGPPPLRHQLAFPAFSYVTSILIVSDTSFGGAMRGCWHALCATFQVVPLSVLSLWLIGPGRFSAGVAAFAVALGSFVVALPECTHLMSKRIAFGQIVIVYVGAVVHGGRTGAVMHPVHVAASTVLGASAAVLALLFPFPRLACFEARKLSRLYAENASERIRLFVEAFSAQDNKTALEAISQAKPFTETGAKLLQSIKLVEEDLMWERPQIRLLKRDFIKPGDRLQDMEIPIRGMEIALASSSPSFPVSVIDDLELGEVLLGREVQIGLKLEQAKCFPPFDATTAPEPAKGGLPNKFLESLGTVNPNREDLTAFFFLFCIELLQDDSALTRNIPNRVQEPRNSLQKTKWGFKRICSVSWRNRPNKETLVFALKCSISLGLAVLFGLTFNKENGYWSGLTIAISFATERQATFTVANARAQGTAMGSVYGVLGCFFFRKLAEFKVLALVPWIIFTSFLRHSRMYGQAGGISAVIGALLILGRKNYGPPAEFAITRLTEAIIGLFCFITVELLLQPTRAATLAKDQLAQTLRTLEECIGEISLSSSNPKGIPALREKHQKLKTDVGGLENFAKEAELEPDFWFSPFPFACYNKLLKSISRMMDLLFFTAYGTEFLVEASQRCGLGSRELQEHIGSDLQLFKKNVGSSLDYLEKITLIKSFTVFEREPNKKICDDLELGRKSPKADGSRMNTDREEADKILSSYLQNSKGVIEKIQGREGGGDNEESGKNQLALCLSALGFCVSGLMRETKEIEEGIKELIQWEKPSIRINFYEIPGKMNSLCPL